jgi:hypothetical protein
VELLVPPGIARKASTIQNSGAGALGNHCRRKGQSSDRQTAGTRSTNGLRTHANNHFTLMTL